MDETYIRLKGEWAYLYRSVDKYGKTPDLTLSNCRNKPAATRFFAWAIELNGLPRNTVFDRSGSCSSAPQH